MPKSKGTSMQKWDAKFAQYAKDAQESVKNIGGGGTSIRFRPGSIEVAGATVPDNRLNCIIIGSVAFNGWNRDKFDPDNPQTPDCYAFGILGQEKEMAPHEDSPEAQADSCGECDKNQFGSAETGRGKACGNNVRLGVLLATDCEDADGVAHAEMAVAKISPTNLKRYKGYVNAVTDEHHRPLWAVVTELRAVSDPRTQIAVEMRIVETIDDPEILDALEARYQKATDALTQPFPPRTERPAAKPPVRNAKFAGTKTGGRR